MIFGKKEDRLLIISLESELRSSEVVNERLMKVCEDQLNIIKCQQNRIDFLEDRFFYIYAETERVGELGKHFFAHYISNHDEIDWSKPEKDKEGNITSFPIKYD
jgi:hypothetical protein